MTETITIETGGPVNSDNYIMKMYGIKIVWGMQDAPKLPDNWSIRRDLKDGPAVAESPDGLMYFIGESVLYPVIRGKTADIANAIPIPKGEEKPPMKTASERINADFVTAFNQIQAAVHETAVDRGWWEGRIAMEGVDQNCSLRSFARNLNDSSAIALMHSELSEALEALRHGNPPDDKVPQFSGAEAELADCIIRIMDLAQARGWRVAEALVSKAEMNKSRPKMHGKGF